MYVYNGNLFSHKNLQYPWNWECCTEWGNPDPGKQILCMLFSHVRYYYPQTDKDESIQVGVNLNKSKEASNWRKSL